MAKKYQAPSVKKAFQILQLISQSTHGLRITELASHLCMSKGTVHGVVSALEELGATVRNPATKKYQLGITLLELGRLSYSQADIKDVARPIMEEVMEKTGATVYVGVLNKDHITILDIVESREDLKITSPKGSTIPLFAGATGKVMLAFMSDEQCEQIIREKGLPQFTGRSITDPERFMDEIRLVRERGYATDYEEYLAGVWAAAAPIQGWKQIPSAIWAVGFRTSLNQRGMENLIENTTHAARQITRIIKDMSN